MALTKREMQILELLKDGSYQKEVAERLSVSTRTIQGHLHHVYKKLGVRNIREAILKLDEYTNVKG